MKRLLALPCLFAAGLAWGYYSPYAAPFAYGVRMWRSALKPKPCNEGDYLA